MNSLSPNYLFNKCILNLNPPRADDECKPKCKPQKIMIQDGDKFIYYEKDQFNKTFTYIKYGSP